MKCIQVAFIVLMAASATACYRVAGRPYKDVNTVGVRVLTNRTLYGNIDLQLTDQVNRELSALTFYTIASPAKADAVLEAELFDYQELPEAIDENETETVNRLTATATFKLVDTRTGRILAGPGKAQATEVYRLRTGRSLAEVRELTLRKLAQAIIEQAFLPWPKTGRPAEENKQE